MAQSEWSKLATSGFKRSTPGSAPTRVDSFEGLNLDTTLLPRAAMLGWIKPGETKRVRVFLAGAQPAVVDLMFDDKTCVLMARTGDFAIAVGLGVNERHISVVVRSGRLSTRAELVSENCTP